MIYTIIMLVVLLFVLPVAVGGIFSYLDEDGFNLPFRWVSGQVCLWTGFQFIGLPLILRPRDNGFTQLCITNLIFAVAMLLISWGLTIRRRATLGTVKQEKKPKHPNDNISLLLCCLVIFLLVLQLVLAVVLAYEEGDDAFYIATSNITVSSDTMYETLPYLGGATGLDARHGLAPFPIWVAMIARLSHLHAATVAQIVLPVVFILMAYTIYYMLGRKLFVNSMRRLPLFMLLLEMLVLFGGYSLYSAENFLLVRTAQGKAVLANIVIPFILLLLFMLIQDVQQSKKISIRYWLLLGMTFVAGCLCSTQGALLTCVLLASGGICIVFTYRKWKLLLPMAACCVLPFALALLYLFLD